MDDSQQGLRSAEPRPARGVLGFLNVEPIVRPVPGLRAIWADVDEHNLANGVIGFLLAMTGPVSVIISFGLAGGLQPAEIASWISIAFLLGGTLTLVMGLLYRQPLVMGWTIPGAVIAGVALAKFTFPEVIGAYLVTGVLMVVLGVTGGFKKLMDLTPLPIVMAMVAGIFLNFGILAVKGFGQAPLIAVVSVAAFVVFTTLPKLGRYLPPVLAALIAGAVVVAVTGRYDPPPGADRLLVDLIVFEPAFSQNALVELVIPLAISVLALQNAQGIAFLELGGHRPPTNVITTACGLGSLVNAIFGSVCTCLTGPATAVMMVSGETRRHYIGALVWGVLAIAFGLFAPAVTTLAVSVPIGFVYVIGGLAMMRVLQQSFTAAFGGRFVLGALVTFVVTVTDLIPEVRVSLFGVGPAFWGIVFGIVTSLLLERGDFGAARQGGEQD